MKIERFFPSAALIPYVKEFMIIESDQETCSKTIPGTSMVMSFRYKGKVKKEDGAETTPSSGIAGMRKSPRLFYYAKETANLLVVFREGGFAAFANIPAHELFELTVSAENLFPAVELSDILEHLAEAKSNRDRIDRMEIFLLRKLLLHKQDLLVGSAIQRINQHNGIVRIKDLATTLHISQDPFEKRFRAVVGATPKQYASIVRLRTLIRKYPAYPSLTEASYEAGYFDQSHFIKDFRQFTGQAPKDFFKSFQYW